MTLSEFLTKLKEFAKTNKFYLDNKNRIPCDDIWKWANCPIEALANDKIPTSEMFGHSLFSSVEILKLDRDEAVEIIRAADNISGYEGQRKLILEACGLSQPT